MIRKFLTYRPYFGTTDKRGGLPYLTHGFCRTCEVWIEKDKGWGKAGNRCPCCHSKMSYRPRVSKSKRRYRKILSNKKYLNMREKKRVVVEPKL